MRGNFRDRRKRVDMIVIHSMGEFIGGSFAYDFLDEIGLSAHFLVDNGGTIFHGVDSSKVAFHAGISEWEGETDLNENSVGIELLVEGDHDWNSFKEAIKKKSSFTDEHYEACAKICEDLMKAYPDITKDRIVRHSDISGPDVRPDSPKLDPGDGFEMHKLKEMIDGEED